VKDNPWWMILIQGIIGVLLALYIFFAREQAILIFGLLAAGYVFVMGLIQAVASFTSDGVSNTMKYRALAGLIIGIVLFGMYFFNVGSLQFGHTLLAIGLIVYGGLGLWAYFFDRGGNEFEWGPVIINALLVVWGVLVFIARGQDINLANISAWILLALGAAAIGWAFVVRSRTSQLTTS
jgi:uncharacterized membrane protein HdeD (DUF308 family)